jgi:predicted nucleotidyltransferase component of viral defense system
VITPEEIEQKSSEFGIHVANVQRDYVFGWFLLAVFRAPELREKLVLKGGNCLRKAYFPNTRFSNDLDLCCESELDADALVQSFNSACQFVQDNTGVQFDLARSQVRVQDELDNKRRVLDARVYFNDFYGNADHIWIRLSIDITEFDRIYLPIQERKIIHPYSDEASFDGSVRCLKLEELVANKLKCLLQRKHVPDVYDLVYSVFVNKDLAVDRREVLSTFLRKTIYQPSPGVARQLLLELPLAALRGAWERYIVAPVQGLLDFDEALARFTEIISDFFREYQGRQIGIGAFFPSELRSPIIQAGTEQRLISLKYDGATRIVEPYSLVYKTRKDGHGEEYLYVFDRTGGRTSGPGIKTFVNTKIQNLQLLDEKFVARYPIELAKAGELGSRGYFSQPRSGTKNLHRAGWMKSLRKGWRYSIQCPYCSRIFKRMRRSSTLRPHWDKYDNRCVGRRGTIVSQSFS